jgi:hypothetical protein
MVHTAVKHPTRPFWRSYAGEECASRFSRSHCSYPRGGWVMVKAQKLVRVFSQGIDLRTTAGGRSD